MRRQDISSAVDPLGWRLILGTLITHVPVDSLLAAVRVADGAVNAADSDAVTGHLGVELCDDRVVLRLQDRSTGTITDHDLSLAGRITGALSDAGWATVPGDAEITPQVFEIAVDALDIASVRPFWRAITGYVDLPDATDLPAGALIDPLGRGPTIWFQQMDSPRPQRNRIHLDVDVAPERAAARIEAALAAGGRLVSDAAAPAFWVLADAEGNEACICTWQGRD
ncbi:VOC family protein [Mycolicibacterium neoaurum]|uniref:VOC family protein n=1 Tax=Mycolicibacterium neoaurum TaxID=1795 RepID=UPI00267136B2|nr:VOC family protein [Mycolicibacterium neoaurum]MDO3402285.1 VOC family protein [Mycolicibacterium neoaurum]